MNLEADHDNFAMQTKNELLLAWGSVNKWPPERRKTKVMKSYKQTREAKFWDGKLLALMTDGQPTSELAVWIKYNNNNNSQIFSEYAGCGEIPMYTILPLRVLAT